eukprot:TRINITY_DN3236_c0_g2_i2.p1 TRINITY_DN3236_c0_g2~~TRINITY_DN3236_c0_g2_i2.p1  ORF type:complete len:393 (-),score=67.98 TRINITY_DN3236_c0_g2_i2:23-1201(-)
MGFRIEPYSYLWVVAAPFSALAVLVSIWLIYKHLRNYTSPRVQRWIVRILIMVPVYAIDSFLSLRFRRFSSVWDLTRDCYEAYCLYCFFCLIYEYVEISTNDCISETLATKEPIRHPIPLCCFRFHPGGTFLVWCRRWILQFVIIKPVLAIVRLILEQTGHYLNSPMTAKDGFLYILVIENISITLAMYYLVLFYMATKEELQRFAPMGKFMSIKAVIFFSFWQGVVISGLNTFDLIPWLGSVEPEDVGTGLQNFIICIEMFIMAIIHHKVFSYAEYRDPHKRPFLYDRKSQRLFNNPRGALVPVFTSFVKVVDVRDVMADTKASFITPLLQTARPGVRIQEVEEIIVINQEYVPISPDHSSTEDTSRSSVDDDNDDIDDDDDSNDRTRLLM